VIRSHQSRTGWGLHIAAFCVFAVAALWTSRPALMDPATVVTLRLPADAVWLSDIKQNVAQIAYVSRALWTNPRNFFEGQMCYPVPAGIALGEHMLGEGLLALPAYLLWDDPLVTFNFVVTVRPLIGAVSMYALAYYWTGSFAAALIAGFAFGFHPMRLRDLIHPSVVGNELIPAILLSMNLLVTRRRWRDAFVLTALTALQMIESLYVLLQLAMAVGVYGPYLLWRHRRVIPSLLPKLLVAAVPLAALASWVFGPYLETRDVWGVLQGRGAFPTPLHFVAMGNRYYAGTCLLLLAAVGLLDRLRGARSNGGHDPRLPMAIVAVIAIWFVFGWRVPLIGTPVPPLRTILLPWLPGLDAVRAPGNALFVVAVSLALLAAYGVRALIAPLGAKPRAVIAGLIAIACVAEVFVPAIATHSFEFPPPSTSYRIRPPERDVAAVRDLPPWAVLNIPFLNRGLGALHMGRGVLLAAYHERRLAGCKASFVTPAQDEIEAIAGRLPSAAATRELWALGLRTVIFSGQDHELNRTKATRITDWLSERERDLKFAPLNEGDTIRVYEIAGDTPVTTDIATLAPVVESEAQPAARDIELRFGMRTGGETFRHPDPIQPRDLLVTWSRDGAAVQSKRVRTMLPLALAPGRTGEIVIDDRTPSALGFYIVTLSLADDPDRVLGRRHVAVTNE